MTIYFDNSITSRPSEKAVSEMMPFLTEHYGAVMSPHKMGQEVCLQMNNAAEEIIKLLGGREKDRFIFTSSGAEAINQVYFSVYFGVTEKTGKNHFITTSTEEAPFLMGIERLEKMGCVAKIVSPDAYGQLTEDNLTDAITSRTALVSISLANGMTGVLQPVEEIAALCRERGILLHLDVTHALGKIPYDFSFADYITFNGEQLHAPAGTGGLFVREGVPCHPLICGGMEQEGFRAGNLPTALFAALGMAAKEAFDARDYLATEVARLRNRLEAEIVANLSEARPLFRDVERVGHISAIAFPAVSNEALAYLLQRRGVCASIGGGPFQQIGLILAATGLSDMQAHSALSFSLSRYTQEAEIEEACKIIVEEAKKLRKLSRGLV